LQWAERARGVKLRPPRHYFALAAHQFVAFLFFLLAPDFHSDGNLIAVD